MSNQTDLEKKIEEAAENFKLSDISYPPLKNIFKAGCKHGYTLGREEMLQEVLEYLSTIEHRWRDDIVPDECMTAYYKLESKFKGDMTKDELEKKRDELADKRHKIFPNDTPRIKEKLTEWKNEFLDGFDSCAAILQVELDALNRELADERSGIQDRSLEKHLRWEVNKLTTQLQSANAKLAVMREALEYQKRAWQWFKTGCSIVGNDGSFVETLAFSTDYKGKDNSDGRIAIIEHQNKAREALAQISAMDSSEGKVEND